MENKCPIESTLSLISGKWKILILKELSQGPVRYGQIGNHIPSISAKVLTQQLRQLTDDRLVVRSVRGNSVTCRVFFGRNGNQHFYSFQGTAPMESY